MRYVIVCVRCHQQTERPTYELDFSRPPVPFTCESCREADRAPQGEALPLFTPAPAVMPGQTTMDAA